MDWKQFFASMVASLAWPAVVAYVLFLLRTQVSDLVARMTEFSLPGGGSIKLSQQVERVREQAEKVEAEQSLETPSITTLDPRTLRLAQEFPEAAVLEAYKELEAVLLQIRPKLKDGKPFRNPTEVLMRLQAEKYVSDNLIELFDSLRRARNAAAHAPKDQGLTPGEAIELVRQAKYLTELLIRIQEKL
jgi:hypothetical protein